MGFTNGAVTIPKSTTLARIKDNSDIYIFQISAEDMKKFNN
jgi:methylglyoxal/glyoxal reductase